MSEAEFAIAVPLTSLPPRLRHLNEHMLAPHRFLEVPATQSQLRPDRTSCRSALANQVRLVLHTAAYWLMLDVRDAVPKIRDLAKAEFATLNLRLLKIAARVMETRHRVRIAFAAGCPEADLVPGLTAALLRRRI